MTSAGTEAFKSLLSHRTKVKHAVIGTHFYQTHPDVLDAFVGSATTRFMLQPAGVFHPKVYCFHDGAGKEFEIIIGSANFTQGAMTVNTELSTLISHKDGQLEILDQTLAFIEAQFKAARTVSQEEADNYRKLWKLRQPDLEKLEGQYGETKSGTAPVDYPRGIGSAQERGCRRTVNPFGGNKCFQGPDLAEYRYPARWGH